MIPSKLSLTFWRGTSFELELVSQVKRFIYDPAVHTGPADLKRTHAENLDHYGYVYEYVDFSSIYQTATMDIMKPWKQNGDETRPPLFSLSTTNNRIQFTTKSVKLGIAASDTRLLVFNSGVYKLLLTTPLGKVDGLIFGEVTVEGERG